MLTNWIDNLNERGRMVLFGVVVLALAVLCGWVLFSGPDKEAPEAPAPGGETTAIPTVPPTAAGSDDASTDGQPGEEAVANAGLVIDAEAPVSADQVTRLGRYAADFTIAYQSFRYDENTDAKITRVRAMLSDNSQVTPELSVPDGPMLATYRTDKTVVQVTPRTAHVTLIAPTVVSFEVTAEVATTSAGTTTRDDNTFNVTLYRDKGSWGVGTFDFGSHEHE